MKRYCGNFADSFKQFRMRPRTLKENHFSLAARDDAINQKEIANHVALAMSRSFAG